MAATALPRAASLVGLRGLDPTLLIPVVAVAVLLGLTALPLAMLVWGSFLVEVSRNVYVPSIENYLTAYGSARTYTTFANSLVFAGGSALLALAIGTALAWLVERTTPGRQYFFALALVPLIIPGVLSTIAWIFWSLRTYPPDYGVSGALAVGLLSISAVGVWIYGRMTGRSERYSTVTGKAFRPRQVDLGAWRWLAVAALVTYFVLIVGMPFFTLLWACWG